MPNAKTAALQRIGAGCETAAAASRTATACYACGVLTELAVGTRQPVSPLVPANQTEADWLAQGRADGAAARAADCHNAANTATLRAALGRLTSSALYGSDGYYGESRRDVAAAVGKTAPQPRRQPVPEKEALTYA